MKISATVSEFRRDVVQILGAREGNDSPNKEVNNLSPIQHHWINSDRCLGSERVVESQLPGDPPPRIYFIWGVTTPTTKDLLRT